MKIIKHFFYCVVILVIVITSVLYLSKLFRPAKVDPVLANLEVFSNLPSDSIDVIIYGSSLAWRDVDTMEMYDEFGIGAYNYSASWQRFNTTELFIYNSLKTQSPKVALVEVSRIDLFQINNDMDGEIYYTKSIPYDNRKKEYLNECFSGSGTKKRLERTAAYYLPFIAFHSNWNSIDKDSFFYDFGGENFLATMGYHNVDISHGKKHKKVKIADPKEEEQLDLSEKSIDLLNKMLEDFKTTNTKVIFFVSPKKEGFSYSDAMKKYSNENNCDFINLFEYVDDMEIDSKKDFYDPAHLNCIGAKKEARYLSSYIKEKYELEDKRLIPDNLWEQAKKLSDE